VAVLGSDVVLPRDARGLRLGRITVRIGPPLYVAAGARARTEADGDRRLGARDELDAIGRLYMTEIARLLG
jgi:1-acyl-sn-glycerol-3-phosphate acyltransferase